MSDTGGRILLTVTALLTAFGGYVADWNETHVFNPRWPGHAKFHNGQTMSFGLVLGCTALYLLWTPAVAASYAKSVAPSARAHLERARLRAATYCSTIYWVTQASAIFYPGSLCVDPEFGTGCPQVYIDSGILLLVVLGYGLVSPTVERRAGVKSERVRT